MTNVEKFLKDGVDIKEIANGINEAYLDSYDEEDLVDCIYRWFETEDKPTLTEDERVILRNVDDHYTHIVRRRNGLLEVTYKENNITYCWGMAFSHLFQFIKERRRI